MPKFKFKSNAPAPSLITTYIGGKAIVLRHGEEYETEDAAEIAALQASPALVAVDNKPKPKKEDS